MPSGFQGYAQKDPLVMYKSEGFKTFEACMESIATLVAMRILEHSYPARRTFRHPDQIIIQAGPGGPRSTAGCPGSTQMQEKYGAD